MIARMSERAAALDRRLRAFMDAHVYPSEETFRRQIADGSRWEPTRNGPDEVHREAVATLELGKDGAGA